MTCEMLCEAGWLPLDREEDHDSVILDEGDGPYEFLPLLIATQFVPCPRCNVLAMCNLPEEIVNGNQRHTTSN